MKNTKLKLYVWEGVLCDYTCGIIFALARSPEHARKMILKQHGNYPFQAAAEKPELVSKARSFAVLWGRMK